ncbi:hypothetical protein ENUP19_0029G0003 [Entamoeba nuttalli]|uniref:Fungal lipase-type domain-containing protein n=1 Tax=Entamoeba nuttalli TaxID=412467 RepID=A0ABQ0D9G2_9EUKA
MGDSEQQDIETINSQQQEIQVNNDNTDSQQPEKQPANETTGSQQLQLQVNNDNTESQQQEIQLTNDNTDSQQQETQLDIEMTESQENSKRQNKKDCCYYIGKECVKIFLKFCSGFISLKSAVSLACQFQLLFFINVILIGIFILFIISTGHLVCTSTVSIGYKLAYGYVMVYGSLFLLTFIYYFILFSIEYLSRSYRYLFGDEKSNDKGKKEFGDKCCKICCPKNCKEILECIFVHHIGIVVLVVGVIVGFGVGRHITKKHGEPSVLTYMGYWYLLLGLILIGIIFFIISTIDYVCKLYDNFKKCSCKSEDICIDICIKAIFYGLPNSFINRFIDYCISFFVKKRHEECRLGFQLFEVFAKVALLLLFLVGLIFATVHSCKNNGNIGWYWLIFIFSFISGAIPSIRELSKKPKDDEDEYYDGTIKYSDTESIETENYEERENPKKESNEETENKVMKVLKGSCGFNFRRSSIPLQTLSVLLIVAIIVGLIVYKIKSKKSSSSPKKSMFEEENEYISFRARMKEIYEGISYDDEMNEGMYYRTENNDPNKVYEHSHLCESDSYGITPFEYACFSNFAYADSVNDPKYANINNYLTKGKGWEITIAEKKKGDNKEDPVLHYLVAKKTDITVFGFRGSKLNSDWVYDFKLFTESALPSLSVSIFPVFTNQALLKISYILSLFGSKAFPKSDYDLLDIAKGVVESEMKNAPKKPYIVTGHSLGGGLANIVGSELGIVSFGISPPGTYLGAKARGLKKKDIRLFARAVIPDRDPVASLGVDGGLQMPIPCYERGFDCHSIDNSVCMIGALCHYNENGNIKNICSKKWDDWKVGFDVKVN